jgi:hypothetical protein
VARPAPAYIPVETISALPIVHTWDDYDPYPLLGEPDDAVIEKLSGVALNAVLAYALGAAEWVFYRLKRHTTSNGPWDYVDAAWASLVIWEATYIWEPGRDHCDGPVRGAIDATIRQITNCINSLNQGGGEVDAAMIGRLAEYVLPDPSLFKNWQEAALERLAKLYDRKRWGNGPATPREALDPNVELTAESGVEMAWAYFRSLDFSQNEFLNADAVRDRQT